MKTLMLASALLISGCASPLASRPDGWPQLAITEHFNATPAKVAELCGGDYLIAPNACAYVDLCKKTCDIYYQTGKDAADTKQHEYGHCRGQDHWFSVALSDLLRKWQSGNVCQGASDRTK